MPQEKLRQLTNAGVNMTNDKTEKKDGPSHTDVEIKVANPRYEGATPEMVGRVLLQRPLKDEVDEREW